MEKENFTPSFFKADFRAGKTIKQIASEHYVSSSYISHIVCDYEKSGKLTKLDRCTLPPDILIRLSNGSMSFYEAERQSGRSYRYLKRYVKLYNS